MPSRPEFPCRLARNELARRDVYQVEHVFLQILLMRTLKAWVTLRVLCVSVPRSPGPDMFRNRVPVQVLQPDPSHGLIGAAIQYRYIAEHPPYNPLGDSEFPGAQAWSRSSVYLPFGLALSEDDARRVGRAVVSSGVTIKRSAQLQ